MAKYSHKMENDVRELLVRKGIPEENIEISMNPWLSGEPRGRFSCLVKEYNIEMYWSEWKEREEISYGFPGDFVTLRDKNSALDAFKQKLKGTNGYAKLRKKQKRKEKKQLLEDIRFLKKQVALLSEKISELEYAPGGSKFLEAETHFEEMKENIS